MSIASLITIVGILATPVNVDLPEYPISKVLPRGDPSCQPSHNPDEVWLNLTVATFEQKPLIVDWELIRVVRTGKGLVLSDTEVRTGKTDNAGKAQLRLKANAEYLVGVGRGPPSGIGAFVPSSGGCITFFMPEQ